MISSLLLHVAEAVNINPLKTGVDDGNIVKTVISIVIMVTAAICLLFITIGGLRYVLSQGDSQRTAKAKGTILYALIGLIITIIAQAIVTFVIARVK
jgi:hypothetical protein